jgi:hypothetical protein
MLVFEFSTDPNGIQSPKEKATEILCRLVSLFEYDEMIYFIGNEMEMQKSIKPFALTIVWQLKNEIKKVGVNSDEYWNEVEREIDEIIDLII